MAVPAEKLRSYLGLTSVSYTETSHSLAVIDSHAGRRSLNARDDRSLHLVEAARRDARTSPSRSMLVSAFCDGASLLPLRCRTAARLCARLRPITIVLGALGSYAAVASGLIMTKWQVWGHGTLLRHHQFVWPAFALMTGLATWRIAHAPR